MIGILDRVGNGFEKLVAAALLGAHGPVVRRHQHHHRRAQVLRLPTTVGGDAAAVVRCRHDHRDAAGRVLQNRAGECLALGIGKRKLLGIIRQDGDTGHPGRQEEVHRAKLAFGVQVTGFVKGRRQNREGPGGTVETWVLLSRSIQERVDVVDEIVGRKIGIQDLTDLAGLVDDVGRRAMGDGIPRGDRGDTVRLPHRREVVARADQVVPALEHVLLLAVGAARRPGCPARGPHSPREYLLSDCPRPD